MQIEIDSFCCQGKGHKQNQDYVIHGTSPFPYIILADGCSSSPHTDIGARIICHKIKKSYEHGLNVNIKAILDSCDNTRKCLNLPQECLDCTVITCTLKNKTIEINIHGDGSFFIEYIDGSYRWYNIHFPNNAPFYPNYYLNKQRMENYKSKNEVFILTSILENEECNIEIEESILKADSFYDFDKPDKIKSIMISSDGLSSFGLSFDEAYQYFSSFKTKKGEFIKRRAKRALKELEKEGFTNFDDVSIGGMYLCHNTI